jgi:hypothetical protein
MTNLELLPLDLRSERIERPIVSESNDLFFGMRDVLDQYQDGVMNHARCQDL